MKRFIIMLTLLPALTLSYGLTNVPAGAVSGTWTKANSPYKINGNITVNAGTTLTIQPGVVVEFMGQYRLTVAGTLRAEGLPADQIKFTKTNIINLGLVNPVNGGWRGIAFESAQDTSKLSNCIVEYVNSYENVYYFYEKAPVDCQYSNVKISDCIIRNNYGAMSGGIRVDYGSYEVINNLITLNEAFSYGGGLSVWTNGPKIIKNNRIINNKGVFGGGIYIWRGGLQILIENNFISQNFALNGGGIYSTTDASAQIIQNIIVNNTSSNGAGVFFENCGKVLIGNTICNNLATGNGGGVYFNQATLVDAENNILWNNKAGSTVNQNIFVQATSQPIFKNNIVGGGVANIPIYPGNVTLINAIDANPLFINPTASQGNAFASVADDWRVTSASPCINAGTIETYANKIPAYDYFNNPRIKFGLIDLGAHEYTLNSISASGIYNSPVKWFADTIKVTGDVTLNQPLEIGPGVVVQMQGYFSISAENTTVKAIGTAGSPIRFEVKDTSGFSNNTSDNGKWNQFYNSFSTSSVFKYCNFSNGTNINFMGCDNLIFENCNIKKFMTLYNVFQVYGNNVIIRNSTFTDCYLKSGASWLTFATAFWGQHCLFENSKIFNNAQHGMEISVTDITVQNNLIANNGGGILAQEGDVHKFYNNTIVYNSFWGINKSSNAGVIANCIIYGNDQDISTLNYVDELYIYNNILQNERPYRVYEKLSANIIANPSFVKPYAVIGRSTAASDADYRITSVSPAIDKGLNSVLGYPVPALDLLGSPRPNHNLTDIGAYENHGGVPVITTQPVAGNLCEGIDLNMQVNLSNTDSVFFQWKKDGVDIPGETTAKIKLQALSAEMIASYTCSISNSYGTIETYPASLNVKSKPQILAVSDNQELCENKDLILEVNAAGHLPLTYTWQKDGSPIGGEVSSRLKLLNIGTAGTGYYSVSVSNQCGSTTSENVSVVINPLPQVDLGGNKILCANSGFDLDPGDYQSYLWNDYTASRIKNVDKSGEYSVKVTDNKGCVGYSNTVFMEVRSPFENEEICMVMTDPETEKNMVIWEKTPDMGTNRYQVWKTSGANYSLVSETMEADASTIIDWGSKPRSKTDAYVLVTIDTCGNVSQKSSWHKPFLLQSARGLNDVINLSWEPYLVDGYEYIFKSIIIYRGIDSTKLEPIDTIAAGIGSVSYIDENPPVNVNLYYRIGGEKDVPCDPNHILGKKASSGPYVHSLSNLEDNRLQSTGISGISAANNLEIYPNPMKTESLIKWKNPDGASFDLFIYDLKGTLVRNESGLNVSQFQLQRENLSPGCYVLELKGKNTFRGRLLVE